MICKYPYVQGVQAYSCGQCMPCRINRRRQISNRILLESCKHAKSSFLTLTYNDEHLPDGGTLCPRDVQLFFKRLRKLFEPEKIRAFYVGEYGDESERPHYHAALFGVGPEHVELVRKAWSIDGEPIGHVLLGDLSRASAAYVAQYCTKKLTKHDDIRLNGRYPEFARFPTRPGLGALAIPDLAVALSTKFGKQLMDNNIDVPMSIKIGDKDIPLGRYLRKKLREALDVYNVNPVTGEITYGAPKEVLKSLETQMRDLLQVELGDASYSSPWSRERIRQTVIDKTAGKAELMEARAKIFKGKRTL